jgi:Sulfotransferase family
MNPYVFFVGCPRSGTTLVQRIGDAHPKLAVIHEADWLPKFYERRIGVAPDGTVTPELIRHLVAHRRFARLELDPARVEALLDGGTKDYAGFVSELFDLHGRDKAKPFVGVKSPGYVRHLPTLHSLWPEAKVVHLIRDGRDVALSVLDWKKGERTAGRFSTWHEDPLTTSALWWEWHVRLGCEAARDLGQEQYYELRYESLVAEPEAECRKLCRFLRLPYDDSMLRFHQGRMRPQPGRGAKGSWLPVTRGLRSWAEQMRSGDVARFEAAVGPLLDELGYTAGAQARVSDDELAHAARLRRAFADEARARGRVTPAAWEVVA